MKKYYKVLAVVLLLLLVCNMACCTNSPSSSASPSSSKSPIYSPTYYYKGPNKASSVPSTSVTSTSSISCDNNETPVLIKVVITTDDYPSETSWKVAILITNPFAQQIIFEGGPYTAKNTLHTKINQVCPQDCFKFKIYDSYSESINDVSYQVSYNNSIVHEGTGDFGSEESSVLFGVGCQLKQPLLLTEPPTSFASLSNRSSAPMWMQLGNSIDTDSQYFAMASDRLVVAVGQEHNVLVYSFDSDSMSWGMIANAIDPGFTYPNELDPKLVISSDGGVVAISDQVYDSKRGRVQIFAAHPQKGWIQLGSAIDGECFRDRAGSSVALSSDGTAIAVGSRWNDGNGNNSGHVRLFSYDTKSHLWIQRGDAINGEVSADQSGHSVAISADGSIVAVGAIYNDGNRYNSGHVRVFEFSVRGQSWVQRGSDLDGEARYEMSGWSVAMSENGDILAIGAIQDNEIGSVAGQVRVYKYSTADKDWVQRGNSIDGEAAGDNLGQSVDISADGTAVIIGSPWNDGNGNNAGVVRVYQFDIIDNLWVMRGADLAGEAADNGLGYDVAMSADGTVVGSNGANPKKLKLMKWMTSSSRPTSMLSSTPNVSFHSAATYTLRRVTSNAYIGTNSPLLYFISVRLSFLFILSAPMEKLHSVSI